MPRKTKKLTLPKLIQLLISVTPSASWTLAERNHSTTYTLASGEGHAEFLIKLRNGITSPHSAHATQDLPDGDVKCIISANTPNRVNTIRLGVCSSDHIDKFKRQVIVDEYKILYEHPQLAYSPDEFLEILENLVTSRMSKFSMKKMPNDIKRKLENHLKLSVACSYPQLYIATQDGYIIVKRADFDEAFKWSGMSGNRLNYKIQRSYIENQLARQNCPQLHSGQTPGHLLLKNIETVAS